MVFLECAEVLKKGWADCHLPNVDLGTLRKVGVVKTVIGIRLVCGVVGEKIRKEEILSLVSDLCSGV